jgi:hypothetical protein
VFYGLAVFGFMLCAATGLMCAVYAGARPGPRIGDGLRLSERWRGAIQLGVASLMVGILGQVLLDL